MKTLNELAPKERLELYEKALVDWTERPNDFDAHTDCGLCAYFQDRHKIDPFLCRTEEWLRFVKEQIKKNGRSVFLGDSGDPLPRIAALKAMIKELEEAL